MNVKIGSTTIEVGSLIHAAEDNYTRVEYSEAKTKRPYKPLCFGCGRRRGRIQAFMKFDDMMEPFRVYFVWCGRRSCTSIIENSSSY